MGPYEIYPELCGQRLTSVLVHEPWDETASQGCPPFRWPLFGALVLAFERHHLLLCSPLRYRRCQQGTRYGLTDGRLVTLGLRALLCDAVQAEALVSLRMGLPPLDTWWNWAPQHLPAIGRALRVAPWVCLAPADKAATVMFDFDDGLRYRLAYRQDLDGAIAFAPEGVRSEPGPVEVSQPKGPYGWLHARNIGGFVLDDRRWRNTEHWPIEVRRQYRGADPHGPSVLQLLRRAWLAYFRQRPDMGRRLLALRAPVRVAGLPEGFVEAVRDELSQAQVGQPIEAAAWEAPASVPLLAGSKPPPAARC